MWKVINKAQTASELAIFGTILVFVIGVLIRFALSFNYNQDYQMRAFKRALQLSYANQADSANRSLASVTIINDRDIPELSDQLGIMQRTPYFASATAMYNSMLFGSTRYPYYFQWCGSAPEWLDDGHPDALPVNDIYVNNERIVLSVADYAKYPCPEGEERKRQIIWSDPKWAEADPNPSGSDYWRWLRFKCEDIDPDGSPDNGLNITSADIDNDGKEETIFAAMGCQEVVCEPEDPLDHDSPEICNLVFHIAEVTVLDSQLGEIDTTINSADLRDEVEPQGFKPGYKIYARVNPGSSHQKQETYTEITNTNQVRRADFISREIQLNPAHIDYYGNQLNEPNNWHGFYWRNRDRLVPIANERCQDLNKDRTCLDVNEAKLYVRSRINVGKTRIWKTPH
ncbi:MAG: hypothetical protein Q8O13_11225 [Candidatus Omnitrophota bacterium]|nr:hypothetical protein [Candidatus Omnitrophota bacterium]